MMEPYQFTVEEANAFIPWLADKFAELNRRQQECTVIRKRILDFQIIPDSETDIVGLRSISEHISQQIEESIEEILDQGIIIRDEVLGLVDFPSLLNEQDIYLCWINGETRIDYWHETDRGFSHRKSL